MRNQAPHPLTTCVHQRLRLSDLAYAITGSAIRQRLHLSRGPRHCSSMPPLASTSSTSPTRSIGQTFAPDSAPRQPSHAHSCVQHSLHPRLANVSIGSHTQFHLYNYIPRRSAQPATTHAHPVYESGIHAHTPPMRSSQPSSTLSQRANRLSHAQSSRHNQSHV